LLLRMLKRWLREQLLPKSTMEPGMQDSIVTLLGYLGGLLVLVLTLAALHVNLTSITWIVSALSVGIGFGLQAIVQNFISGLILLVERPVKVATGSAWARSRATSAGSTCAPPKSSCGIVPP